MTDAEATGATGRPATVAETHRMTWPLEYDQLTPEQFARVCHLAATRAGIHLPAGKRQLVAARVRQRMRALRLVRYDEYFHRLERDAGGREAQALLDALTTNLTGFFREADHFAFLRDAVLPAVRARGRAPQLRIWSAGCATGEEAYSLAITVSESFARRDAGDVRILATDLSTRALAVARAGRYPAARLRGVSQVQRLRHFQPAGGDPSADWVVKPQLRRLVTFARLNLTADWPMRGPFDVIFCRNVMIYFAPETQAQLVPRFRALLAPRGWLFLGHAESLTGRTAGLRFAQPSVYQRAA